MRLPDRVALPHHPVDAAAQLDSMRALQRPAIVPGSHSAICGHTITIASTTIISPT